MTSPKPAAAVDLDVLKRVAEAAGLPWHVAPCKTDCPGQDVCLSLRHVDGKRVSEKLVREFAEAFQASALSLIAELEQLRAGAPRWIAVSERMPDDEQPVWLHQDGWSVVPGYREFDVWRHREDWRISQPSGGMQPTHWAARYEQPAPSPPEAVTP